MIVRRGFLRLLAGAAALPVVPAPEPQWNTLFFTGGRESVGILMVDAGLREWIIHIKAYKMLQRMKP